MANHNIEHPTVPGLFKVLVSLVVGGFVAQVLWNWLLPSLFGLPLITFWQAFGLLVLGRILTRSFGK